MSQIPYTFFVAIAITSCPSQQKLLRSFVKDCETKYYIYIGTAVAQWLKYCATNRKVAGSIPANVSGFFTGI